MLNVSKSATSSKAKASPSTLKEPETLAPAPVAAVAATQETIAQPAETTNPQEANVSELQQTSEETTSTETKSQTKLARTERSAVVKGVALPPASRGGTGGGKSKYGWEDMEPGDAFFVPDGKVETFYTLISSAKKKTGKNFTSRKLADGAIFGEQYAGKPGVGVWCIPNE